MEKTASTTVILHTSAIRVFDHFVGATQSQLPIAVIAVSLVNIMTVHKEDPYVEYYLIAKLYQHTNTI
jgi:hypothetical protein